MVLVTVFSNVTLYTQVELRIFFRRFRCFMHWGRWSSVRWLLVLRIRSTTFQKTKLKSESFHYFLNTHNLLSLLHNRAHRTGPFYGAVSFSSGQNISDFYWNGQLITVSYRMLLRIKAPSLQHHEIRFKIRFFVLLSVCESSLIYFKNI